VNRTSYFEDKIEAYLQRNKKRYRNVKGPLTLHEAIQIAKAEWRGRGLTENTIVAYTTDLKEFSKFAHKSWSHPCYVHEIDKFKCADFRAYLHERDDLKGSSIQRKIDTVRSLFNVLVQLGYVTTNPMALIENSRDRRRRVPNNGIEPCPLTMDDLKRLLSHKFDGKWGLRDQVLFYVLVLFAPRSIELRLLRWWHLDGKTLTIKRVKGNLPGVFEVPDFLLDLLYRMRDRYGLNGDDPIFISQYRRELSPKGLHYIMQKYKRKLGFAQLRAKDFRTLLLTVISRQWDPRTVQAFIGHLTPETANRFYERRTRKEIQAVLDIWVNSIQEGLSPEDFDDDDNEELGA
jgi:site-specific recombinase XerD